ncbi:MAG: hypothetical protein EA412_01165 [Chitinophagaceae bacterium]|nr:MAG: hypothetical protein EA412_01165 [Chitinophagaceae bacterium]
MLQTPVPTNSSIVLLKLAVSGLKKIYKEGYYYKKSVVVLMGIVPGSTQQLSVFREDNHLHTALMQTVDKLNGKLGQQKIKYGCQD